MIQRNPYEPPQETTERPPYRMAKWHAFVVGVLLFGVPAAIFDLASWRFGIPVIHVPEIVVFSLFGGAIGTVALDYWRLIFTRRL